MGTSSKELSWEDSYLFSFPQTALIQEYPAMWIMLQELFSVNSRVKQHHKLENWYYLNLLSLCLLADWCIQLNSTPKAQISVRENGACLTSLERAHRLEEPLTAVSSSFCSEIPAERLGSMHGLYTLWAKGNRSRTGSVGLGVTSRSGKLGCFLLPGSTRIGMRGV